MTKWKPKGTYHLEIEEMFPALANEPYLWCLHCERAASRTLWNHCERCPYPGCDGSYLDAFPWSGFATDSQYPTVPVQGHVYPLCSDQ